jgi:hypothetical protein
MEIDERLFEAFSPNQLKDPLNEAAEIELPPIRPTWGGGSRPGVVDTCVKSAGPDDEARLRVGDRLHLRGSDRCGLSVACARDTETVQCGVPRRTCQELPFPDGGALQVARSAGRTAWTSSASLGGST